MGFKSMTEYNGEKYANWFRLQNDGDYADVIFLYRGMPDVMMADTHYIKSDAYSGYVLCCDADCPACRAGIRKQPKIFVPLFVLATTDASGVQNRVQFWDRTTRFQPQLVNDVFRGYPDPSGFIFRITRHGVARDINTTYDIRAIRANNDPNLSYDAICSRFSLTFPDCYNTVCKDVDRFELGTIMSSNQQGGGYGSGYGGGSYGGNAGGYGAQNYGAAPRGSAPISNPGTIPGTQLPYTPQGAPNLSMPNVPLSTSVPAPAPDPDDDPFGSSINGAVDEGVDPDETDEDLDTTDLQF